MEQRPELSRELDGDTFRSYYYLKEELTAFCREEGIPAGGGKQELSDRIAHYLDTGEAPAEQKTAKARRSGDIGDITEETLIEPGFVCSERHRAFFKERIGKGFSFHVAFQRWLKCNAGKTYAQAVEAYRELTEEKKKRKTVIDRQFEYNTYIRDYFEDNRGGSLEKAIKCWKYKKSLKGHNRYERTDRKALEEE